MRLVRYHPDIEQPASDEAETIQQIGETFEKLADLQLKKEGHAMRTSHAKATGILRAEQIIGNDLLPESAQGIAAESTAEGLPRHGRTPDEGQWQPPPRAALDRGTQRGDVSRTRFNHGSGAGSHRLA
ncbi:MAG TPA: hypothetical protein VM913_06715 [Sphingomicrobium sp.]|nr:hypothetical protein [Sphingomicrobium sp.]